MADDQQKDPWAALGAVPDSEQAKPSNRSDPWAALGAQPDDQKPAAPAVDLSGQADVDRRVPDGYDPSNQPPAPAPAAAPQPASMWQRAKERILQGLETPAAPMPSYLSGTGTKQGAVPTDPGARDFVFGEMLGGHGYPAIAQGAKDILDSGIINDPSVQPGRPVDEAHGKKALDGASEIMEGGAKALTPVFAATAGEAPIATARAVASGYAASKALEKGSGAVGASPEVQRFLGNAGWLVGPALDHAVGPHVSAGEIRPTEAVPARNAQGFSVVENGPVQGHYVRAEAMGGKVRATARFWKDGFGPNAKPGATVDPASEPAGLLGNGAQPPAAPPMPEEMQAAADALKRSQAASAVAQEAANPQAQVQRETAAQTPAPKPEPVHPTQAHFDQVAALIDALPEEKKGAAILQVQQSLAATMLQNGKTVLPGGKIVAVTSPEEADKAATDIINDVVGQHAKQQAAAQKEAQKAAAVKGNSDAKTKPELVGGGNDQTVPETKATLDAQTKALANGSVHVVYVPKGATYTPDVPAGMQKMSVNGNKPGAGTYLFNPEKIKPSQIRKAAEAGEHGQLLGNVQTKDEALAGGNPVSVVARDGQGSEVQAAVVDGNDAAAVHVQGAVLQERHPDATIATEHPEKVIQERQGEDDVEAIRRGAGPEDPEIEAARSKFAAEREREAELAKAADERSTGKVKDTSGKEVVSGTEKPVRSRQEERQRWLDATKLLDSLKDGETIEREDGVRFQNNGGILDRLDNNGEPGSPVGFLATPEHVRTVRGVEHRIPARDKHDDGAIAAAVGAKKVEEHEAKADQSAPATETKPSASAPADQSAEAQKPAPLDSKADRARQAIQDAGAIDVAKERGVKDMESADGEIVHTVNYPGLGTTLSRPSSELQTPGDVLKAIAEKFGVMGKDVPSELIAKLADLNPEEAAVLGTELSSNPQEAHAGSEEVREAVPDVAGEAKGSAQHDEAKRPEDLSGSGEHPETEQAQGFELTPPPTVRPNRELFEQAYQNATNESDTHTQRNIDALSHVLKLRDPEVWKQANIGELIEDASLENSMRSAHGFNEVLGVFDRAVERSRNLGYYDEGENQADLKAQAIFASDAQEPVAPRAESESNVTGGSHAQPTAQRPALSGAQGNDRNAPSGESSGAVQKPTAERPTRRAPEQRDGAGLGDDQAGDGSGLQPKPSRGVRQRTDQPDDGAAGPGAGSGASGDEPRAEAPQSVAQTQEQIAREHNSRNYHIEDPAEIGAGGEITKAENNMAALRLLKRLRESGRLATPEEQKVLSKFVGWGGLSNVFSPYHEHGRRFGAELKTLLTPEEYETARKSTQYAHYTSPEVVTAMWDAIKRMGFEGGNVLEPSMGIGNFFGLMPRDLMRASHLVGVEMDQTTGEMAHHLYPDAKVFVEPYQKVMLPNNSVDVAIGNVPFSDNKVADPHYDNPKLALHNYFLVRTLDKLKPGGVMAMITSRYSFDGAKNEAARMQMAERADLVAAIRLPDTAFKKNAGTEVVTDLLIFRKRMPSEEAGGPAFLESKPLIGGHKVNEYFHEHPEHVVGEHTLDGSMYRAQDYNVSIPEGQFSERLQKAMATLPENIFKASDDVEQSGPVEAAIYADSSVKDGAFTVHEGKVMQKQGSVLQPLPEELNKLDIKARLKDAIELREALKDLLREQLTSADDKSLEPSRKRLNQLYDKYVKKHGPLHAPKTAVFKDDPEYPLLLSLENYSPKGKIADKAPIFTQRTAAPYEPLSPENFPKEAKAGLSRILAATGKVDLATVAKLSGRSKAELAQELEEQGLVYQDPVSGEYQTADEYLSGNVRQKLADAEAAAKQDPSKQRHVEALKKVQPADLTIHEIDPKLGATWVPMEAYTDFLKHLAKDKYGKVSIVRMPGTGEWLVRPDRNFNTFVLENEWSGGGWNGLDLFTAALNQRMPSSYKHDSATNTKKFDPEATMAAREMQSKIKQAFKDWARQHATWPEKLEDIYNQTLNNRTLRKYDGSHLMFPGMNPAIKPMPHQQDVAWRIIQDGRALVAHVVGAGKTFETIMAAMEMRRMGLSPKNLFVVPNNMLAQWRNDWVKLYPGANVLAVTDKDFTAKNRQKLMARIATGDYDGIIVTHSANDLLSVSPEREERGIRKELSEAREVLEQVKNDRGERHTVKQIEKKIEKLEQRLAELNSARRDNTIYFDQLGVTSLFVDEAHAYKNLNYFTRMGSVSGLNNSASLRATRMKHKTDFMLEKYGNRGVVFMTGTPITNTMAEMYNMTRYVAPDLYEKAGIRSFDDWAANFGNVITAFEYSPDGVTMKARNKFAEFTNLPELTTLFNTFADVKSREDLPGLKVPEAERHNVMVPVTELQNPLLESIVQRGEALNGPQKPDPKVDNWLKLSSDARKISLDPRLYDANYDDHEGYKVSVAAKNIAAIWKRTKGNKGTQLVFSDFYRNIAPDGKTVAFNFFKELKKKLVQEGVPASEIEDINDHDSKDKKEALYERVRKGEIRVLMGSTEKMGVGVNVQKRLVALHHMDQPWRPADIEQREGRIIRQGNDNAKVSIYRYVAEPAKGKVQRYNEKTDSVELVDTPKPFDLQMFQKLETKQRFIDQAMSNKLTQRSMEDAGGAVVLDYATMKAASTGNPDVMKRITISHDLNRLTTLDRQHDSMNSQRRRAIRSNEQHALNLQQMIAANQPLVEAWSKTDDGKIFSAVIDGKKFAERKDAADYLQQKQDKNANKEYLVDGQTLHLYGMDIAVRFAEVTTFAKNGGGLVKELEPQYRLGGIWQAAPPTGAGFINSVAHHLRTAEDSVAKYKSQIEEGQREISQMQAKLGEGSPYRAELKEKQKELEAVNVRLGLNPDGSPRNNQGDAVEASNEPDPEPEDGDDDDGPKGPLRSIGSRGTDVTDARTSMDALTEAIRNNTPRVASLVQRLKIGANLGEKAEAGKDAALRMLGRLQGGYAVLRDAYFHELPWHAYEDATGKWSGAENANALDLYRFTKSIKEAVPDKVRREGISNWIEADGDEEVLRERLEETRSNPATREYAKGYEAALDLTDAEKTIARNIQLRNDATLEEAQAIGMLTQGVENYVMHVWKDVPGMVNRIMAQANWTSLTTKPSFTRKRTLPTYFEGEQLGFRPKDKDVGFLTAMHEKAFRQAIAARAYIKSLAKGKAKDGRPLVATSWASARTLDSGEGEKSVLIKPNIKKGDKYADYLPIDHPALRGWRWAGEDEAGNPTFVEGEMLVHPDIYRHLKNNLSKSAIRNYELTIAGHTLKPGEVALNVTSNLKSWDLAYSGFHQFTLGVHALEHRTAPAGMPELDLSDETQRALVDHGLMVADYDAYAAFAEGLASGGLATKVPALGTTYHKYTEYLFHSYMPRLKMAMAQHALERNRERYRGQMSDSQILALTARQANAAFGGLNYKLLGRNRTLQDVARLVFMAPDFFEARTRFWAQAAKPEGAEQRQALLLGALVLYTAMRILNQILDGKPHWNKPFTVVHRGKEYSLRTVQGDMYDFVTDTPRFLSNRLSPLASLAVREMGERHHGHKGDLPDRVKEETKQALKSNVPIPAQPWMRKSDDTTAQKVVETIFKMIGVNVRDEKAKK